MATTLHQARLDAVVEALLGAGVRRVADLGCGDGELLERLRAQSQFVRLLGIDVDEKILVAARERLGLDLFNHDERLQLCCGSFENTHWAGGPIDAAVFLETIEHIEPGRLSRVEQAIFCQLHPQFVVITTPNKDYNPLHGLAARERRHPGHRFEWTRAQFKAWCNGVAQRQAYRVGFHNIGPPDPVAGSSTQMACFSRSPG
ncbi:methyltransferase domain-containing protein [Wenzhouxiangella limi]|uniref:Small RNA 2'-O-methyltransferase n=1 Tax=Wenzhouxiangella limi TaxID=2707351 RepID=A0A845UXH0_9GAMM|nr:methyltransferase domain-containing protein [Wenzhouxiangella limi]NDY94550.1 methyltransferase domain-containing protein [Wenzhouxiangella limi]